MLHAPLRRIAVLVAYLLVSLALWINNGHYDPFLAGLTLLVAAVGILVWRACSPRAEHLLESRASDRWLAPALLSFLVLGFRTGILYLRGPGWNAGFWALWALALPWAATYLPEGRLSRSARRVLGRWADRPFAPLFAIALAARVYVLVASPAPVIDVWTLLQEGADGLARGENPYGMQFSDPYAAGRTTGAYVYMPLVLLVTAPFRWLFGDVRAATIVFEAASAFCLWHLAGRRRRGELYALLFLFHPRALFVLEQSWTEPIVVTLFSALLLAIEARRLLLSAALAGLFFAAKQYLALLVPLLALPVRALAPGPARLALAAAVGLAAAAAVTLPFALWDVRAFYEDIAGYHLASPLRDDALNLTAALHRHAGVAIPGAVSAALAVAAMVLALATGWRQPSARGFAATCGLALLAALLFQKHAFCNYYYLAGAMLLAASAAHRSGEAAGLVRNPPHRCS